MRGFKNTTRMRSGHSFSAKQGFTGSSGSVQEVRGYTRKTPRIVKPSNTPVRSKCSGGAVMKADGGAIKHILGGSSTPKERQVITSAMKDIADIKRMAGASMSAGERAAIERGVLKKADGGMVDSPVIKRTDPMTQADEEYGGKGPLRPGFDSGGKVKVARRPSNVPRNPNPKSPGFGGAIKDAITAVVGTPKRRTMDPNYAKGGKIGPVKKGALHKAMGIKPGKKIPLVQLEAEKKSSSPLMRKRANFAINARSWNRKPLIGD